MPGPSTAAAPVTFQKRQSLSDNISRLREADDDVLLNFIQDLEDLDTESIGFRDGSPSTQSRQDRHLSTYRDWVKLLRGHGIAANKWSEEELDKKCFPDSFKEFYTNLRTFLVLVAQCAVPRSLLDTYIGWSTLVQYRNSMLFWTDRKYYERGVSPPPRTVLYNKLPEITRFVAHKFGMTIFRAAKPIGELGLGELTQLIDADAANSPCIELAECHHLAWCLARICAVGPGSLAQQSLRAVRRKHPYRYPTWDSMNITRGDHPGQFNLTAEFRGVKGTNERDAGAEEILTFIIDSPKQPRNLVFSPSHRLLVMAIRRGAIEGIDSIEELLSKDDVNIVWKAEFRKKPIFLAGEPHGLSVLEDEAVTDNSLTDYLRQRARRMLGYPLDITYDSFRKESAINSERAFGPAVTRELMGHSAEMKTLETYHLARTSVMDVSATAFDEPNPSAQIRADKRLALEALRPETLARSKGAAMDALCGKIAAEYPNYPHHKSAEDQKRYNRRIRQAAMKQLPAQVHEARQTSETVTDQEKK